MAPLCWSCLDCLWTRYAYLGLLAALHSQGLGDGPLGCIVPIFIYKNKCVILWITLDGFYSFFKESLNGSYL